MTDLVEVLARLLYEFPDRGSDEAWKAADKSTFMITARACLSALESAGYRVVLASTEDEIRKDERIKCWHAVDAMIKHGPLDGNGTDKSAQRNGLILAANALFVDGCVRPPDYTGVSG